LTGAATESSTSHSPSFASPSPGHTSPTPAPSNDPQEIIRRLKDATVYIKTKLGSKTVSSGSGFVIEAGRDFAIVATNRHVAVADLSELPPGIVPKGTPQTLEAVFRSGEGKDEQDLPAQIIAADLSEDMNADLAFLMVRGVNRPPAPINPMIELTPVEGMTYVGAGFPLGGILNRITDSKGNPSVTITRGGIAALRRDDHGQLLVLQVDGSLQPGNSGGPIIDGTTGKLIGVAVAKVSAVDTIGFVVPAEQVRKALAGRVGSLDLTLEANNAGTATLQVKANLVDPKMQLAGVVVRAVPASAAGNLSPNSDGTWPPLGGANTKDFELQRNPRAPEALGRVQVALTGSGPNSRTVAIQAAYRDARNILHYSKPKEVMLPTEPGRIMPPGTLERMIKTVRAKSLSLLGPLVDPSKDCRLDKDDSNFKVRIEVPGKLHTLSPELVTRTNRPVHNAPMTLTDVEGDFAVIVEVTGEINPGPTPPKDRQVRTLPFTVQSAGLIVYQDKDNFLRLERAGSIITQNLRPLHRLIIEGVKDGKQAMKPIYVDVPEGDTFLILIRRKGRLQCLYSPDGGRSGLRFPTFAFSLPPKVKVGLSASNISAQPFNATFQNFALVNDVTKIDAALGD
jgi:S1-C subfamily serine protease